MKLFNEIILKFEKPDWAMNPDLGLIDTILENHPELIIMMKDDIVRNEKESEFGRKDTPTVEQIFRAAIYKEMRSLEYRDLEYAQSDSRICATFIKLDMRKPYCFQMFHKYISRISADTLKKVMVEINRIAIAEGFEDVMKIRQDSTVVESNIHYPTNNSLIWDCIKESHRLLGHLKEEAASYDYIDYTKSAKHSFFKINNTKSEDKRTELFRKQLIVFTKTINQVSNTIKKKFPSLMTGFIQDELQNLLPLMEQVYDMSYRKEILKQPVPNDEKLFSIYELHTDIIVKGGRDVLFGHKIDLSTGKSNMILDCDILRGNPSDKDLFQPAIERIIENYDRVPRDMSTDGGYACKRNLDYSSGIGIVNTVFGKVVGSMKNIVSSVNMETMLKKWRSGIEAVISNLKRGFDLFVCNWKGWEHFQSKVMWSVIAYNFRVLTQLVLKRIKKTELV